MTGSGCSGCCEGLCTGVGGEAALCTPAASVGGTVVVGTAFGGPASDDLASNTGTDFLPEMMSGATVGGDALAEGGAGLVAGTSATCTGGGKGGISTGHGALLSE